MFTPSFDEQWLLRKLGEEGDDCFINAGGIRSVTSSGENPENATINHAQRKALAKFVEFSRRKRSMTQVELAAKTQIGLEEIIAIEDELPVSIRPDAILALAKEFEVPNRPLMYLAGISDLGDRRLAEASLSFAAHTDMPTPLLPEEENILDSFIGTLGALK